MQIDDVYNELIKKICPEHVLRDEPMSKHTSFKIGGLVEFMILPNSVDELQHAIKILKDKNIEYYIIGNGTNILVSDAGIKGAVIKIGQNFNKVDIEEEQVTAQAGILLSSLSQMVAKNNLEGFEFANGIPGTLGGAVAMNAGAYDGEIKDVIIGASVINSYGKIVYLTKEELQLEYRNSIIQKKNYIVLEVELQLEKGNVEEIKAKIKDFTQRRTTKQPLSLPSAGSTFKRPVGNFAGKLIQDAGLKGVRVGGAQVSELHSGFVVNVDNATAKDVMDLIGLVQKTVKDKFGVELKSEVKFIGI